MVKYIDADRLRAEIDRIEEEARTIRVSGTDKEAIGADSKVKLCLKLKSIINSLQQEQPEVDLKEEIASFFSKNPIPYEHITDWPLLKNTAIHFYELGLNAKEENK